MSADDVRQRIATIPPEAPESALREEVEAFEDALLESSVFPEDYADLFIELISAPDFFERKGIWQFVASVHHVGDSDSLSDSQLQAILNAFVEKFSRYPEEKLCLVVCDFIGRVYDPHQAYSAFSRIATSRLREDALNAVLVGLDILRKRVDERAPLRGEIEALWAQLANLTNDGK